VFTIKIPACHPEFSGVPTLFCVFSPSKFPYLNDKAGRMTQKAGQSPVPDPRKSRLAEKRAEALRANLKRRKEQTAARDDQKNNTEGNTEE